MMRVRTYKLFRKTKTKVANFTTALVMVVSTFSGIAPLLFSRTAAAAPGLVYANTGFSSLSWSTDRTAPSGGYTVSGDALEMRVDNEHASATSGFYRTEGVQATLPTGTKSVMASLHIDPSWETKPVRAGLWGVSDDANGNAAWPIIEFASNMGGYTGFRVYDTNTGTWYNLSTPFTWDSTVSLEVAVSSGTHQYEFYIGNDLVKSYDTEGYNTLKEVIFDNFNSALTTADNYAVNWTGLKTGSAPTVSACSMTNTVATTSLSTWSLVETRATGHNALLANGLHIWTEGATSTDKVAGYHPVNFPLANLGNQTIAQSIDYTAATGTAPGLQLAVDFDGNGTFDGYLVGESIYGNNWWLSTSSAQFVKDGAPNTGSGNGSDWFGTPNEWLASFPNAQVKAIGYSLGSGVHGDGVLKRISLGCTNYTFGLAAPTLTAPSDGSVVNGASVTNSWSSVDSATKYEYQSFNDVAGHSQRFDGTFATTSKTATNVADGTVFYWRVRAIDSTGAAGPWSNGGNLWKVTIDSSKPSAPTLLAPSNNGYEKTNDFYFTWTDSSDSGSPVTYEFQSDNNSNFSSPWDSIANGNSEQNHLTSPKIHSTGAPDGTYYWRVRAIDAAGNTSAWSDTWKMTIDTHTPSAFTLTGPALVSNSFKKNTNFNFTWNASTDNSSVTYKICRSQIAPAAGVVRCDWGWTVPSANGTHFPFNSAFTGNNGNTTWYWQVTATDAAGNSTRSDIGKVTIDNTRPTVNFVAPTDFSAPFTTGPNVTVNAWDMNGLSALVLHVYDSSNTLLSVCGSATAAELAANSLSCDLSSLADGTYYIKAGANDKAGNNTTINSGSFTIDSTAPKVTVDALSTTDTTPTVTGAVDDSSSAVSVVVNGHTYAATVSTTANASGTYNWSANVTDALNVGTYDVAITAKDAAGNTGNDTTTSELTVVAPPATPGRGAGQTSLTNSQTNTSSPQNGNTNTQVLGDATTTPSNTSTKDSNDNNGKVQGDSTVKLQNSSDKKSNFLGLGWWWLAVLAALVAAWIFLLYRRASSDKE